MALVGPLIRNDVGAISGSGIALALPVFFARNIMSDEAMFRDAIAAFAEEEVRPRAMEMERAGKIDPVLLPKYFELGLMGIEVPEQYGGAGGTLFMVTLAVEEISKVDAAAAIVCIDRRHIIAVAARGYSRPEDLLRDADTAMYRAKLRGRARHAVFHPAMHAHARAQLQLETDLYRALERN